MGVVKTIAYDRMPKQGAYLGKRARVCFHYDTSREIMGTVVRDDMELPWLMIISLDDGRVVLSTECQYAPLDGAAIETELKPPARPDAPTKET